MRTHSRFALAAALLTFAAAPLAITRSASAADDKKTDDAKGGDAKGGDAPAASASAAAGTTAATSERVDSSDVSETPGKTYYFIGARYRGTIVPKFMMNLFVDEGATVYSNTVGLEVDIRKDGYSLIPALTYVEYGTNDILFLQKGKDRNDAGNWSYVNSGLKGVFATVDLLWSTQVHKNVDFEYGFGTGIGIIFGDLQNNWVFRVPNGAPHDFQSSQGELFSKCPGGTPDGTRPQGCNKANHQNSSEDKVGAYVEKSWFGGGSVPNIFLHLAIPQLGFRFKPAKQFESRLGFGFSLTGFWFGLSADYGLERPETKKTANGPTVIWGQH
jgi:hypothetical protein